MKQRSKISCYLLLGICVLLMFSSSCKKDVVSNNQTVTDIDGNIYHILTIGTQVWMAENLKTTRYRNGDSIGTTSPATLDLTDELTPKHQWAYDGNKINAVTYGRLYTWYAINDSRNICPTGWHIPTDAEWTTLTDFLGGENTAQTNLKGKGFLPQYGGWRPSDNFTDLSMMVLWWSTSDVNPNVEPGAFDQVYCRTMSNNANGIFRTYRYKKSGLSVICIKDN